MSLARKLLMVSNNKKSYVGDISYALVDTTTKTVVTSFGSYNKVVATTYSGTVYQWLIIKSTLLGPAKLSIEGNVRISGSRGADYVYIKPGSQADLMALAGGVDVIYFPSTFESYTKTLSGDTLAVYFSRYVNGMYERISVSTATDQLIFTNGSVNSANIYSAIETSPNCTIDSIAGCDLLTTSPAVPDSGFVEFVSQFPSNKLLANGQLVSRTSYPYLFDRIGIAYGAGDGVTTFQLPTIPDSIDGQKAFIQICTQ
jgi:hypothetical protein